MKRAHCRRPYSLVQRRAFLARMGGVLGGVFGAVTALPLFRTVFPGAREPDQAVLPAETAQRLTALKPLESVRFDWGGFPGLAVKGSDGELRVFKGVCTHADCNVEWRGGEKIFYCACHEGYYDEQGTNIKGPPPRPLKKLYLRFEPGPDGVEQAVVYREPPEEASA